MKTGIKVIIAIVIAVAIVISAVIAIKRAKQRASKIPVATIYAVVVHAYTPKISKVKLTLPVIATVQNDKNVALAPLISARILSIKLSGQRVKKGEVIAKLDVTSIKGSIASLTHSINASHVALKNLIATHKRTKELLKVKGVSIEQYDKELTSIAKLKSTISTLKEQKMTLENKLTYAVIKSPVDGVISKVFFNKGSTGILGHPLVTISADNGFYLLLRVPADVLVKGLIFGDKTYLTTPLFRTSDGLSEYKIYIPNTTLIVGSKVEADVVIYNQKGIFLPFNTILNNNGNSYVLVIHNNQAVAQKIDIIEDGQEGVVALHVPLNQSIVDAKPDILLKLTSGYALRVKE